MVERGVPEGPTSAQIARLILEQPRPEVSPRVCLKCGSQAKVTDSRPAGDRFRRRYVCQCGERWSTLEVRMEELDRHGIEQGRNLVREAIRRLQGLMP